MSRNNTPLRNHSLPPLRIEIRPSKILKGEIGVFAVRRLPKNSVIIDAAHFSDTRFVPWKTFLLLDQSTKKKIMAHCSGNPDGFFMPLDLNYLSVAWHMNHSCNPNVGFNAHDDFVAMRPIGKNEEITWDYGFDETNPTFKMKCACGGKHCRKVITGSDWKKLMIDEKKRAYFSKQLKNFIKGHKI